MLDQIGVQVEQDQLDIRLAVELAGGRWVRGFWAANACLVELPVSSLPELRGSPRVLKIWANELRGPAGLETMPQPLYQSWLQHGVAGAHSLLAADPLRKRGLGVTIGFLDTGIDEDDGSFGSPPHSAFDLPPSGTRLAGNRIVPGTMNVLCDPPLGQITLQAIDCNSPGVQPFHYLPNPPPQPILAFPVTHPDARHGTGMASVAAGYNVRQLIVSQSDGHAPEATVMGWSLCRGTPLVSQSCVRWVTDATAYLDAIQMIMDESAAIGERVVDILNCSYDGFPDPEHPVNVAFDDLAETFDIVVVTAAGNATDSTWVSHGLHNGLSVGAVRSELSGLGSVADFSSRGPLESDHARFFPDVCAIGNADMAHVDDLSTAPTGFLSPSQVWHSRVYRAAGTSVAAPQVSGAAAVYMSRRAASPPAATALETRAAILVNLQDMYAVAPGTPAANDTYTNRNAYGVGFVRDDFIAAYAERFGAVSHIHLPANGQSLQRQDELVVLTTGNPVQTRNWALDVAGEYVVAIAWNRPFGASLSNVDLEVWTTGSQPFRLAQSKTPKNSYERVVFKVTSPNVTVQILVIGRELTTSQVPVHIAARLHPEYSPVFNNPPKIAVTGLIEEIPQPACLQATNPNQVVDYAVPVTYSHDDGRPRAWGSAPFQSLPPSLIGIPIGSTHYIYGVDAMVFDHSASFTANGIGLRLWRPLNNSSALHGGLGASSIQLSLLGLAHTSSTQPSIPDIGPGTDFDSTYPNGVKVAQNRTLDIVFPPLELLHPGTPGGTATWVTPQSQSYDAWPIRIPFDHLFTYNPALGNLALWWSATWLGSAQSVLVDSLLDGTSTQCWRRRGIPNIPVEQGHCPLVGFSRHSIGGGNFLLQRPRLHAMGEPALGEWLWMWTTGFGGPSRGAPPPSGSFFLGIGTSNPAVPLETCAELFTSGDLLTVPLTMDPHGVNGQARFFIPDVPLLLFTDVFAQALHFDSGSVPAWRASSGLHLRIGGRIQ